MMIRKFFIISVLLGLTLCLNGQANAVLISISGESYSETGSPESLTAVFTVADGGESIGQYSGFVKVVVSGTGVAKGGTVTDAFYHATTGDSVSDWYELTFGTITLPEGTQDYSIRNSIVYDFASAIEVSSPFTPVFRTDNTYSFVIDTGVITPTNLHFGVSDGNGNYYDNSGAFSLELTQLSRTEIPEPAMFFTIISGLLGWRLSCAYIAR